LLLRVFRFATILAIVMAPALGQTTVRVSVGSAGEEGDRESCCPTLSADGRFVAFGSFAHTLVPNDANRRDDVFVRDRATGVTVRVSVSSFGVEANNSSFNGAISATGRFVAFQSLANNLVPGDTNGTLDVFLHDRDPDGDGTFDQGNGTTVRVSVSSAGFEANGPSDAASISGDGRYVAFHSAASNLVPGDANAVADVFVRDMLAGTTTRVSLRPGGLDANGDSLAASLSADGRMVAFQSLASNLVVGDTNGVADVFVHDRATGTTTRVSVTTARAQANGQSAAPAISGTGRFVAFASLATDLVTGDTNGMMDVFVHDRDADGNGLFDENGGVSTRRVSESSTGVQASAASSRATISSDGRWIGFVSSASNLVAGDTNGRDDVFVRDRIGASTSRASVDTPGVQADDASTRPSLAAGGKFVAFESTATNLVGGDTNGRADVFVHDWTNCLSGTVGAGAGSVVDVLRINGATRAITASVGQSLDMSLSTGPIGPLPARYVVWVWRGLPQNQTDLVVGGAIAGCTANPTPLSPGATPRPFRCLRGGLAVNFCTGVSELQTAPSRAPWMLHRQRGYPLPAVFTAQAVIEDTSATNASGLSVSNAVVLTIR
jgi:Tol biopolymer transport system component